MCAFVFFLGWRLEGWEDIQKQGKPTQLVEQEGDSLSGLSHREVEEKAGQLGWLCARTTLHQPIAGGDTSS